MNWQEVCEDPSLQDLPFKIELNEYGQIVMSPASNKHGRFQMRIGNLLVQNIPDGEVISECSVDTPKGVKVADVAWLSAAFLAAHGDQTPYPVAPEICVEITWPSNAAAELEGKRALYFAKGVREVWVCDSFGNLDFYDASGPIEHSALLPDFPDRI